MVVSGRRSSFLHFIRTEMPSSNSVLYFAEDFDPRQYKLVELPKEVADLFDEKNNGGKPPAQLVIRGLETDEAVLCTPSTTYAIRDAHTSNSLLLLEPTPRDPTEFAFHQNDEDAPEDANGESTWTENAKVYEIRDCLTAYLELAVCQPRVERLRTELEEEMYLGPTEDAKAAAKNPERKLHTLESLREIVQASDQEILEGLDEINAVCIDGAYRLLDPSYQKHVLQLLLTSIAEQEYPVHELHLSDCLGMFDEDDGIPDTILAHTLKIFSDKRTVSDVDEVYQLSETKVCRFLGEQLLAQSDRIRLEAFVEAWEGAVMDPFVPSLDMLKGLYLIETMAKQSSIRYFPKSLLPMDAKQRFERLFHERRKWEYEDLLPYISDLAPNTKKLDAILLKYARMSKVEGKTFYSSRFAAVK
ncbi:Sister chromatid cohesion protein DCC1 [Borealophlyctis nickersoniae]|nr:Sister chromatid cohesion protein DCC1 [Borealophlyctis nickersoniae]